MEQRNRAVYSLKAWVELENADGTVTLHDGVPHKRERINLAALRVVVMLYGQRKAGFALLLSLICLPLAGQVRGAEDSSNVTQQSVFGPHPLPIPPPTLEQQPASAPQVSFRGGELTILARNSSLGAILRAVQTQTGASMDMPIGPTERVVGQFGPGPAREVLASLLNGSHFNYVLLGSPQDATSLDRVVLMNNAGTDAIREAPHAADAAKASLPYRIAPFDDDVDIATAQDSPEEVANQEQPSEDQANQGEDLHHSQPAVKTPRQLLQESQQQQLQQGQPGTPLPRLQNTLQK